MELNTIVEALRATTVVGSQKDAVAYLDETSKMIGFLPLLTQIAMNEELEVPVRQAAIIFFKNGVSRAWVVDEGEENITPISEQDKHIIRREILNHILNASLPVRVHLCTAIQNILRHDYPREWPDFPGSIAAMLHVDNFNSWLCALQVTHRLTKLYEYKRQQEKQPLLDFMTSVLPLIYVRMESCVNANLVETAPLEHMVLKVFYTLTQFSMSTEVITVEVFGKWIELLVRIIDRPIPDAVNEFPEDERSEQYPWKCKKWAMKIIQKLFDRYGAKGQVEKTYSEYAQYYFDHYAIRVIQSLMRILQDFHQNLYVPDRYLYFALTHLADSLSHAEIWMIVKPHFNELVFHIIFPLLCYSEDDEELWESEEVDFVKQRHDCFDELHSPYAAAANVLVAGLKRKGVLDNLLQHFVQLLQNPETNDRDVDGALHVISNMMAKLASSRKYKKDVEKLIALHITPRLTHGNRFIRLHACYCLRMADEVSFKTERVLKEAIQALVERVKDPNELLAIKIEAGVALNDLLEGQKEKAEKYFKAYVRDVLTELFRLLNRINLDELTTIADSIIENFPDEVIPVAIDIANEIHSLFVRFANINGDANDGDFDDNSITVIGLLSTLQTLLDLVDDSPEISARLEPIVFDVIRLIYESESVDFYEDTVTLVESLITKTISPKAWEFYPMIRKHFDMKGEVNNLTMTEYMGCLYSYLVVGTDEFLRVPERANMMIEMCDATLKNFDIGADPHLNAAKLLECFILQCRGRIDEYIPHILQITMNRLQAGHFENTDNQLVPQLLVVLISAMYYNFNLFVQCLPKLTPFGMETVQWIFAEIFANKEFIEGIHNRKMVLYAVCLMLKLPREHQPPAIANHSKEVMEFCLDLFEGIERCLKAIAERKKEEESSDEEESDDDDMNRTVDDELRDSDDDIDEGTLEYLEQLSKSEQRESRKREANAMNPADAILENIRSDSEDSELYETFNEETDVESYVTPLDHEEDGLNVYIDFKQSLENLQNTNRTQFDELTSVDGKMAEALKKLFDYCVQQENLVTSRMVSKSGGYKFTDAKTMGQDSSRLTMSDPQMIGNYDYRGTSVEFFVGPIDKIEADVVVVSSDERLTMNFGAAHAILVAGGPEFNEALYAAKLFYATGPLSIDCSMVDSLAFRKVLVIPLKYRNRNSMRVIYREALKIMIDSGTSVGAMPLIGCGGYNLPVSVACREMCEAISSFTNLKQIRQLKFVDLSRRTMEQLYIACGDLGTLRIPEVVLPYQIPFVNNVYGSAFNGMSMLQPPFQQFPGVTPLNFGNGSDIQVLPDNEILYVGVTRPKIDPDEVMSTKVLEKIYTEVDRSTITDKESSCSICLNELATSGGEGFEDKMEDDPVVQMKLCIHQFHRSCINKCLSIKKQCPLCMKWYTPFGTQPNDAKMRVKRIPGNPPGHGNADGWFKITYTIPSGIQGPNHIRPGQPYTGTTRSAYVPNDTEGRLVLQLLKKAFEYRHTFTIGDSVTTGRRNVPVMVIHHKTNMVGGPMNYGYPDPDYYRRVRNELEQLGITPAMLDN